MEARTGEDRSLWSRLSERRSARNTDPATSAAG